MTMRIKTLIATALTTASLSMAPAFANDPQPTPAETEAAKVCAQALGFAGLEGEVVTVVPKGAGSVNLSRYDTAAAGIPAGGIGVSAFDLSSCQPVQVKIWVQDQLGEPVNVQETAVASFPASDFESGVKYIRAERALNLTLGFLLRGTN